MAFEKSVQGIWIKSVRSSMEGGVTCRSANVRRSRFDFSLEITCNDQSGTKWYTSYSTTQLVKKGVALVTKDSRVDCEVVWKLVAIVYEVHGLVVFLRDEWCPPCAGDGTR